MRYAYLHGFASSPLSKKAVQMAEAFAARGLVLERPDLNQPDFAHLTLTGALAAVEAMTAGSPERWCLLGSSMGGAIAALFAHRHPERVHKLVLLCPGFDLVSRWPTLIGAEVMARWQREGALLLPDGAGAPTPVHWGFIEDAARHPAAPHVVCPTLVFHGRHDATVPIEGSRAWVADQPDAVLVELDDDHRLLASASAIIDQTCAFWGV